jgi:hypothetical protein
MRGFLAMCLVVGYGLVLSGSSHADYRLNCRLMDAHDPNFKRWCLGQLENRELVVQCAAELCKIKVQNYTSVYSRKVVLSREPLSKLAGAGMVGGAKLSAAAPGTVSAVSASVGGVATGAGGLIGRTLSTVGF